MEMFRGIVLLIALLFSFVTARVPGPNNPAYKIQHPAVLTRPPTRATPPPRSGRRNRPASTTADRPDSYNRGPGTPDNMDMDELLMMAHLRTTPAPWFDMYGGGATFNDYGFNAPSYDYFGFGAGAGGSSAGGISAEVSYNPKPSTPAPQRPQTRTRSRAGRRRNRPRPIVTPVPTTTTPPMPTTPEPMDEPDMMGLFTMMAQSLGLSGGNSGGSVGTNGAAQSTGPKSFCYCSPLSSCPQGSVARGGESCGNFISFFLNIQYQRCCYRPSYLRRHGF